MSVGRSAWGRLSSPVDRKLPLEVRPLPASCNHFTTQSAPVAQTIFFCLLPILILLVNPVSCYSLLSYASQMCLSMFIWPSSCLSPLNDYAILALNSICPSSSDKHEEVFREVFIWICFLIANHLAHQLNCQHKRRAVRTIDYCGPSIWPSPIIIH